MHRRGLIALIVATNAVIGTAGARELRLCADPNNLPFSNAAREGFENRLVALVAHDLGATVRTNGGRSAVATFARRCAGASAT